MDYMVARNDHMSSADDGVILDIVDLGTGFVGAFPDKSRSAEETTQALRGFIGREGPAASIPIVLKTLPRRRTPWLYLAITPRQADLKWAV